MDNYRGTATWTQSSVTITIDEAVAGDEATQYEKFAELTRKLVAVPKEEIRANADETPGERVLSPS